MITSKFNISDAVQGIPDMSKEKLHFLVHEAARALESELGSLSNEPIVAEWTVPGSPSVAMLKLSDGSNCLEFPPLPLERLGSIDAVRKWFKDPVWRFVTNVAKENQTRILKLAREIRDDLVTVER